MRLRALDLTRFGHFTDRHFDFGEAGERPDFHIVYGPNEAGKTTTMEAVLRLFYGFPLRETYGFRHQRANLRVSGLLETDGAEMRFTRLPARSGSLVDANGAPVPEAALAARLGGLGEADYRNLLCLDDETIERGGEEIVQARGDIGRLLFSAAAGLSGLSAVLAGVRDEADRLWRKRASTTRMAELKRELADIARQIREQDVSAGAWRGLRKALADSREEERDARAARDGLRERLARVASRRRSVPLLAEIDRLEAETAPFAAWPGRLDFDPESLVALLTEERQNAAEVARLTGEIERLTAEREALPRLGVPPDLSERLDALEDLRRRDANATLGLDRQRASVAEAADAMVRCARELGVAAGTDPDIPALSRSEIARLESAREAVLKARSAVPEDAPGRDGSLAPEGIIDLLARYDIDRLVPEAARAETAIRAAEEASRAALDALGRGDARFDALPFCPQTEAEARLLAEAHADLTRKAERIEETLVEHRRQAAARAAQAARLTQDRHVISDAQADSLQAERDRLWQAHRAALNDATASAFEQAMARLDDAAQARLAQARELGQLRQIEQERAEAQAAAGQTEARLDAMRGRLAEIESRVNAAATESGLAAPMPPAAWLDWMHAYHAARDALRKCEEARRAHRPVLDRAARLLDALRPFVKLEEPEFAAAIEAARALAETERRHRESQAQAERIARLREAADRAARDWSAAVEALLGGGIAPETLLASLDPLRGWREQAEKRAESARLVTDMEADQRLFAQEVARLADACHLPEAENAAATFNVLRERAKAARSALEQSASLAAAITKSREVLHEKQNRLAGIAEQVRALGRLFPPGIAVAGIDDLRAAAATARSVIDARDRRAKQEAALLAELSAPDLASAREAMGGATLPALEAEEAALASDLAAAEERLTRATESRAEAGQALARITGGAEIAALVERKATLELELEDTAREHLELSLGHLLAEQAIRRYRDAHRSGMMEATERSFAALTQGAYPRLTTQKEGDGEALLALDASGAARRASEMSKGTRFQLYLALRAAAYEQLVAQGVSLPFFCDDIFETFDEARTSAACRLMERIGRSGQAIYLTHHRHVVDIARSVCDVPPMVHEIG